MWECGHQFKMENCKKLKTIRKSRQLNAYESYYITTAKSELMNKEPPPIDSYLFNLTELGIT